MADVYLKNREYIAVEDSRGVTFGGRQSWMSDSRPELARCGCGAVAAADLFLYLARSRPAWETPLCAPLLREPPLDRARYAAYLEKTARRYARPLPPLGKTGAGLALGVNRYFSDNRLPLRARWRSVALAADPLGDMRAMLEKDLPVILTIPAFPLKIRSLRMYRTARVSEEPGGALRYRERGGHFVTACAALGGGGKTALEVSSWGSRYYLDAGEYIRSARTGAGLLVCGFIELRAAER